MGITFSRPTGQCPKCGYLLDAHGLCSYCLNPRGGAWQPDHPFQKMKGKDKEYLIFRNLPPYPSKEEQVFGAILVGKQSWAQLREQLSPDVAEYARVWAATIAEARAEAKKRWWKPRVRESRPMLTVREAKKRLGKPRVGTQSDFESCVQKAEQNLVLSVRDLVLKNKRLEHDYSVQFQETFGVSLHSFMDPVQGFDIIRFDDEVVKSGDKQMSGFIRQKYGQAAVDLVTTLIGSVK